MVHVASLTSATTISTQSRNRGNITDKGSSVLSIACDMPVYEKDLFMNFYYYRFFFLPAARIVLGVPTRLDTQSYTSEF